MICIEDIHYKYAGSKKPVFDGLSLQLNENNIYGLLGKNGMGKSTLLYLLCGLLFPQRGRVTVDGADTRKRLPSMLEELFIVPEEYDLPRMSMKEMTRMYQDFYPRFSEAVMRQCLDEFELERDIRPQALSMGQKKKVFMSLALAANTRYLFMDEPTNGLDIPSKVLFRKVVAGHMTDDRLMIISTHQVHDVESLLDHLLLLDQSEIVLNESVSDITSRYDFGFSTQPATESVLYSEPSLQGMATITRHEEGTAETPLNLELLFNAVTKGGLR